MLRLRYLQPCRFQWQHRWCSPGCPSGTQAQALSTLGCSTGQRQRWGLHLPRPCSESAIRDYEKALIDLVLTSLQCSKRFVPSRRTSRRILGHPILGLDRHTCRGSRRQACGQGLGWSQAEANCGWHHQTGPWLKIT